MCHSGHRARSRARCGRRGEKGNTVQPWDGREAAIVSSWSECPQTIFSGQISSSCDATTSRRVDPMIHSAIPPAINGSKNECPVTVSRSPASTQEQGRRKRRLSCGRRPSELPRYCDRAPKVAEQLPSLPRQPQGRPRLRPNLQLERDGEVVQPIARAGLR